MRILSIDTSTSAGSIALSSKGRLLGEINIDSEQTHSVRLLKGVETLLDGCGFSLKDIDAFAVVCGPGSFTGIRIGLATVKGLADSLSKPTFPITAFEAWVEKFPHRQGILIPVMDARRGEVYGSVVERNGEAVRVVCPGVVEKASTFFSSISRDEACFIGAGAELYGELINSQRRPGWSVLAADPFLGHAMTRIAWRRAQDEPGVPASRLQAYYLRRSDAELNWKER